MTLEELKQEIEQRTGVQASLLKGETVEENIAYAKAVLAFRKEHEAQRPKTAGEQFAAWYKATQGIEDTDEAGAALADIEERARVEAGGYPMLQDGGVNVHVGDCRSAREQFADWIGQQTAFDPFKEADGWYFMDSLYVRSAKLTTKECKEIGYKWNPTVHPEAK